MTISLNVTRAEYDAIPAMRSSLLKRATKSLLHFRHAEQHGGERATSSMQLGTAAHAAVLEPERFAREFKVYPGAVRNGREYEFWSRMNPGVTAILEREMDHARGMAAALRAHAGAARYLREGKPEVTLRWTDARTGIPCKARPDWVTNTHFVGLKTANEISGRAFAREAERLGYPLTWAWYVDGFAPATGRTGVPACVEIVVENRPPHDIAVYRIPDSVIRAGREEWRRNLDAVHEARQSGVWPGQEPDEVDFELPSWGGDETAGLDFSGTEDGNANE